MARRDDQELMTLDDIAKYLKVSSWTVYRFVREGRLPCYRLGHQWRFKKSLVEEWLEGTRRDLKKRAKG
jgi:excisionase family DNA binding protein